MLKSIIIRLRSLGWIFFVTVVAPTLIAVAYFSFIATDVYLSEAKFVIRSPDKTARGGLGLLISSVGFSRAGDEIYVVDNYVLSRDALAQLNKGDWVRNAFRRSDVSIFDRFDPLGWSGSFEDLYEYYQKKVSVEHDTATSITTLTVRAFDPRDAQRINEQLLHMAESTVNRLSQRGRQDLVNFAAQEVSNAKASASDAAVGLARYRNRVGVVDPERQASVQLQMVSKLQDELIANRAQLRELRVLAPRNPQVPVLEARVRGLEDDIDGELGKVVGNRGSLAASAVEYQRLQLENQFAEKQLASALASLEDARNEALRKQAYVERVDQPNLPDKAVEPRRVRGVFATFLLGLVAWGVLTMLLAGVREHKD
jgi:capsular polysaccharide transport system permease protein